MVRARIARLHDPDRAQVDRRKGAAQAAGHQGGAQVGARHGRREEAASLSPGDGGAARDSQVSEVDRAANSEASVPTAGTRDCTGLQVRPTVSGVGGAGAAGGE
ncbi:hypothetical protein FGB62_145g015 [Gracilaria domingensis]|nr:hypothetical protein FGB62_145g015 [Gracilaria domingensis]